ncbi:MAG TPA: hypothetical protein VHE57_00850 [Mycobacteriales bacterium]|nr:hypothetical protein [Mycobacteriales bacterium]
MEAPPTWDVRLYRRTAEQDERTFAILHAGNFGLPRQRGDFGSGAVELMKPHHAFVSLFEYEPEAARTPLFAKAGLPSIRHEHFSPRALQRTLPGQSGVQYFFHVGRRAFCLYVVLGSHRMRSSLVAEVNRLLATVAVR